jgi:hypothetical protein
MLQNKSKNIRGAPSVSETVSFNRDTKWKLIASVMTLIGGFNDSPGK